MKNNTKVRLRLSKQLFESLTKEIIKEAKANDGYTVAVKQPKTPKQSKAQAASPEVQKTDKEAKMEAAPAAGNNSASKLGADMIKKGQAVKSTPGLSGQEIKNIQAILDLILAKSPQGETAVALQKALNILTQNTKNLDKGEEQPASTKQQTHSPGSNYTQGSFMGQRGEEKPSRFTSGVAKPAANQRFEEMETRVAEEGQLDEFTGTETESSGAIAMLAAALGMGVPLAAALIKDLMKKKTPEEKKQAVDAALTKKTGTGTTSLEEYEHHYEMVNGQCRRYNDEGDYEVVSSHYCR